MFSRGIILSEPIPIDELKQFVEDLGGEWQDCRAMPDVPDELTQGYFVDGDAGVFLRGALKQEYSLHFCLQEDIEEARRQLGQPKATLTIDITRTECERGFLLADHVTAEFLKRWPGVVFDEWTE